MLKKYYNEITKQIVEYPEEAAALFPVLKLVPSEREATEVEDTQVELELKPTPKPNPTKNGDADAK